LNRFLSKKQTESNWNRSVWTGFKFFFLKISVWLFFFIKTEPNRKSSLLPNPTCNKPNPSKAFYQTSYKHHQFTTPVIQTKETLPYN
jgi:hypothetical protein